MNVPKFRLLAPAYFWLFQIIIHIIRNIWVMVDNPFFSIFSTIVVTYPLDMISFGVFYYFFAPQFFNKTKIYRNIGLSILYIVNYGFIWVLVYYYWQTKDPEYLKSIYFSSFGHSLNFAFMGVLLRLGIEWFEKREKEKELEKQNIRTELALLRSQVNPHFLFNTLNNIHSFATQNSEKTSFAIIKLSEIMRYMLYEASAEKVLIEKEIQYIRNYIELQKLRYKHSDFVNFRIEGDAFGHFVPPMLFIPFIENAFKHGKKLENEKIEILIRLTGGSIFFSCSNRKRQLNDTEKSMPHGVGIQNIQRRLELLFPQNHQLQIIEDESRYKIVLNITSYENILHSN